MRDSFWWSAEMNWKDLWLILRHSGYYAGWLGYRLACWEDGKPIVRFRPWLAFQIQKRAQGYKYTDDTSNLS